MSRATWRVTRTELLRGVAPVAAIAMLAAGGGMLYSDATSWAGQWMPFAAAVRSGMFITGTLAIAAGAWQSGRERRRRLTDQLNATPRPAWQPMLVAWAGVTLGCWLGLLVAVVAGAALVARVATYSGGGWWWLILVTFVALAALSALGVALGRLIPYRLTGPVAAIVFYALMVYAHDDADSIGNAVWLAPILRIYESFGNTLPASVHVQQLIWFGGLTGVPLVLAGARRRVLALVPATVAATAAVLLLSSPANSTLPGPPTKWEPDPAARELVCTEDELVCLPRDTAFLLNDVTPYAREVLDRFKDVPGGPVRAQADYDIGPGDQAVARIETGRTTITGDLYNGEEWNVVNWSPSFRCGPDSGHYYQIFDVASMWAIDDRGYWGGPQAVDAWNTLKAMPEAEQKAWIGELIAAAESCDTEALDDLAEQVS